MKDFLTDHQVDLIHCHTYAAAALGARTKRHWGTKTLVTIHEVFDYLWYRIKPWRNARIYRLVEKWIVTRNYDHIHVPSEFTKQCLVT
ncbi:MAG: glycosyltransferase [Candidatus Peribacteria bacterium]|nr:MAG: glycosyltransferase [Candidatus Peribacteria bacterium]